MHGALFNARTRSQMESLSLLLTVLVSKARRNMDWSSGEILLSSDPFGSVFGKRQTTRRNVWQPNAIRKMTNATRRNWPFLRDRRIDAYAPITQIAGWRER